MSKVNNCISMVLDEKCLHLNVEEMNSGTALFKTELSSLKSRSFK